MIGFLRGDLRKVTPEVALLDVHGVGYEVHISVSTFYELEKRAGGDVELFIYTHVREGEISLFGFLHETEKALFIQLIGVSGIGPRLARSLLSGMPLADLVAAISQSDALRLARAPGVGKKTAERLVVELRDKVRDLAGAEMPHAAGAATLGDDDLVSALVNLGYKRSQAEGVVAEVLRSHPEGSLQERLRASLKRLSRA